MPAPVVNVCVEGMKFVYQLTEDDLHKVFSRYGSVKEISVDEVGTGAQITFDSFPHAQAAMSDLNGKVLSGLDGTLRIQWVDTRAPAAAAAAAAAAAPTASLPPPYPMMPFLPDASMSTMDVAAAASAGMSMGCGLAAASGFADAQGGCSSATLSSPMLASPSHSGVGGDSGGTGGGTASGSTPDAKAPAHVKGVRKYTCRFLIGIDNDKDFQVVRRIIGAKGANMKRIVRQTDAKLRLRGIGSGYFEGAGQKESNEPLQLCVSCTMPEGYRTAVRLVEELLEEVYAEHRQFCREHGRPELDLHPTAQLVSSGRDRGRAALASETGPTAAGCQALDFQDDDGEDGEGSGGAKQDGGRRRGRRSRAKRTDASGRVERGDKPPKAPPTEEIERLIDARNEARRQCNFAEADRIRQSLHERGIALMDEPGGRGKASEVTTWRYWRE